MENETMHQIEQAKRALEDTIKLISEVKELDDHESYLDKYGELIEGILQTESNLNKHISSFQMARIADTIPEFDAAYTREIVSSQSSSGVKQSAEYAEMMQTAKDLFRISAGEDVVATNTTLDEDLAIEENIPTVDPLTKGPLENPVKNKICGHIYGKISMSQAIQQGHIRCPQMGCMNKQPVMLGHLVEDNGLKMKLAAMKAKDQAMEEDSD